MAVHMCVRHVVGAILLGKADCCRQRLCALLANTTIVVDTEQ